MECVVEHTYLRHSRHQFVHCAYAFEVAGVVYRCQIAEAFDALFHAFVHDDTLLKEVTTLHDAVAYSVDFVKTLYRSYLRIGEQTEHKVHTLLVVGHVVHYLFLLAIGESNLYESLIESDALRTTGSHD